MPVFTIRTPRGDEIDIDAQDEATAIRGAQRWDYEDLATSEATAAGLDPAIVLRQMHQESGARADAVSPKGARGPMQLMPATAQELGVDLDDPYDNIRGGVRYLKQQYDRFGSDELALAAYNAGPGAVEKHGGVPPYAETQDYVRAILDESDARAENPVPGGQTETARSDAPQAAPTATAPKSQAKSTRSLAGLPKKKGGGVWDNFSDAFTDAKRDLGQTITEDFRRTTAQARAPRPTLAEAASMSAGDLGRFSGIAGGVADLALRPLGSLYNDLIAEPIASQIDKFPLDAYEGPRLTPQGFTTPRKLSPEEAHAANVGSVNLALSALPPGKSAPRLRTIDLPTLGETTPLRVAGSLAQQLNQVAPQMVGRLKAALPTARTAEELKRAKTEAYRKAESSGFQFDQQSVKALAQDFMNTVTDEGGPELYAKADAMARRLAGLAERGGLTPTQLDRYRSQLGKQLMQPGSTEADLGAVLRGKVDTFMDGVTAPLWAHARDLNTRFRKMEAVEQAIDSADLGQAATGNGANANAIRQKIKPLVDPKSNQRIRNLTPAEEKAMRRVVKGTPVQNTARALTAFDPFAGKMRTALSMLAAGQTGGMSAALAPLGVGASLVERASAEKALAQLKALISSGGLPTVKRARSGASDLPALASPFGVPAIGLLQEKPSRKSKKGSGRQD